MRSSQRRGRSSSQTKLRWILDTTGNVFQRSFQKFQRHPRLSRKSRQEWSSQFRRKPKSGIELWMTKDDHDLMALRMAWVDTTANECGTYPLPLELWDDRHRSTSQCGNRTTIRHNRQIAEKDVADNASFTLGDSGQSHEISVSKRIDQLSLINLSEGNMVVLSDGVEVCGCFSTDDEWHHLPEFIVVLLQRWLDTNKKLTSLQRKKGGQFKVRCQVGDAPQMHHIP